MTVIDISVALREGTPEWPGDTPFSCRWTWEILKGASVNVSALTASPHVGTHADAPLHVENGWAGAESLPLEAFLGPVTVVDVRDTGIELSLDALDRAAGAQVAGRLLLHTGQTIADGRFPDRWPVLSDACARGLVARGLQLLGVDAPSVDERESRTLPVHRVLFTGGACILENLDLRGVEPGVWELLAAPLKIEGGDAAPVRAVLRTLGRQ